MAHEQKDEYVVQEKVVEAPGVFTLKLVRKDGTLPTYCPGQYVTVYFPETKTPEGKAYSISSAPFETTLNLTIKRIGEFSEHLTDLTPGDSLIASLPYGYFYSESKTSPLAMVAAGIGIAPFRGMLLDAVRTSPERRLALFYSNRTIGDIVFKKLLNELSATHPNFTATHFITRQENIPQDTIPDPTKDSKKESMLHGRMSANIILEKLKDVSTNITEITECEFLLCGSIPFVRDLWRDLKNAGISEEAIYTEAFFSQ